MMKITIRNLYFLIVISLFSVTNAAPRGLPTLNSNPIPKITMVKNTDTVLTEFEKPNKYLVLQ